MGCFFSCLCLLFIMRKIWDGKNDYSGLSNREWLKLCMIPLFTMAAFLAVFFGGDKRMQSVSIFLAVGLIMVNLIVVIVTWCNPGWKTGFVCRQI